jgi:hypothetical protein
MKNDILLANYNVIKQDLAGKISDVIRCLKLFNDMYDLHRSSIADIYVDPVKKVDKEIQDNLQVFNTDDFERIAYEIAQLVDNARDDNLTCTQLISDFQDRGDSYRYKNLLLPIAAKFEGTGIHAMMDQNWIRWIRNLLHSSHVWSDILDQRLSKCLVLFDDVSELIFLSDKVFPFILDSITRLSQENKLMNIKLDDQLAQWKELSHFLKGLELKLTHLKAKLSSKWLEGAREVGVLFDDVYRLKKMVSFLWGEASATRIYNKLATQIQEISKSISRLHSDKNVKFSKSNLASLAEKIFNIVVRNR